MPLVPRNSPVPPGGYHFIDKSGGVEVRIDGGDYADVAAKVLMHRLKNSRPPGNPLEELHTHVCTSWPWLCDDTEPRPPQHNADFRPSLALRTSDWMGRFTTLLGKDDGTSQETADKRAATCASCPRNQNYRGGCSSCVQSIDQNSFMYRRGRTTPSDSQLGSCDALDLHCATAVWSTRLPELSDEQKQKVPDNCWRKNT